MKKINILIIIMMSLWTSCNLPDNSISYENSLVVFGRLNMFEINENEIESTIDTVYVSMSAAIDANVNNSNELYINEDAAVLIYGAFDEADATIQDTIILEYIPNSLGKYLPADNIEYKIWPSTTYTLNVNYTNPTGDYYEVNASTTTPKVISINSISSEAPWNCEECSDPTIFGQINCETQGETWTNELQDIATINVNNFNMINEETFGAWWDYEKDSCNCDVLDEYIENETISSIDLSRFGCSVGSFASKPYFILEFDDQNIEASAIKIISYALESKHMDYEPSNDLNNDGEITDGEFFDYNENKIYDETRINTFYDTTIVFQLWKGPYLRDENYNPYLDNPFTWTVETSPSPIMWLYFNYYGKYLMIIQSSDDAYYDYLSGDPLGFNQYILPDSNIEGGYGLFSSNYSKPFFINVNKAD